MPMDFLNDISRDALICSLRSQNGGMGQRNCMHNSAGLHCSFYNSCGQATDAPDDTKIKLWVHENKSCKNACNKSHRQEVQKGGMKYLWPMVPNQHLPVGNLRKKLARKTTLPVKILTWKIPSFKKSC